MKPRGRDRDWDLKDRTLSEAEGSSPGRLGDIPFLDLTVNRQVSFQLKYR